MHSLAAFGKAFPGIRIVVVLAPGLFDSWQDLCRQFGPVPAHELAEGGATRFHSVLAGLHRVEDEGFTAIHDAARPLVTPALIRAMFRTAEQHGCCIPAIAVTESVRIVGNEGSLPFDRDRLRMIQTPQVFRSDLIRAAYRQPFHERFTDDATVAEGFGAFIHLGEGDPRNLKITRPGDLALAEALLAGG